MSQNPQKFLTYKDIDVSQSAVGQTVGPNTLGEYWMAVTAEFDGKDTRVGFRIVGTD